MPTGVARFKTRSLVVVMYGGPMMVVCSEAVMMLRVIVIRVCVDVQPRDLAGHSGQGQPEQDRYEATHHRECI